MIDTKELVEKIWGLVQGYDSYDLRNKEKIRKLLQERQPEKVTVTREEIEAQVCPIADNVCISNILKIFKSKNVEVVEK